MKKLFSHIILVFCALAVNLSAARAQEPGAQPERTEQQQAIRQALIQKIEAIKYERLKTSLGMNDATARQFFEVYKPAEHDIQALVQQRNDLMRQLAAATSANSTNADVTTMAEKIRDLNQQISGREQKLNDDLKPILTPLQRAKLLVFEHEFAQRVREEIAAHRLQKQQMRNIRRQLRQQRMKAHLEKREAAKPNSGE